jgi:hypothetical protein
LSWLTTVRRALVFTAILALLDFRLGGASPSSDHEAVRTNRPDLKRPRAQRLDFVHFERAA